MNLQLSTGSKCWRKGIKMKSCSNAQIISGAYMYFTYVNIPVLGELKLEYYLQQELKTEKPI